MTRKQMSYLYYHGTDNQLHTLRNLVVIAIEEIDGGEQAELLNLIRLVADFKESTAYAEYYRGFMKCIDQCRFEYEVSVNEALDIQREIYGDD